MQEIINIDKLEEKRRWLSRKIYITRKCRIETSERLNKNNQFYQFINVYYSLFVVALSIISLLYIKNDNQLFSTLLLVASIMLTMFSLFYATKNHAERYFVIKSSYIRLGFLYSQIEYAKPEKITDEFIDDIHNKYNEELDKVENHNSIDYLKAKKTTGGEKFTYTDYISFYFYVVVNVIFKALLLLLPIISFTAYCLYKDKMLSFFN